SRRRVAIHAEDEARLRKRLARISEGAEVSKHPHFRDAKTALLATERCLRIARKTGALVHILHISTKDELPLLAANKDLATCEVTPQHLLLHAPDCYSVLGSKAQMNPPVRDKSHQDALFAAVRDGLFDTIG